MTWLVFAAFATLLISTYCRQDGWERLKARPTADWLVDGSGLVMQGVVVPAVETGVLVALLLRFWPSGRGALDLPAWASFTLNFVFIDYLYYWNHRLLHGKTLWRWHALHHTAERLDVWVTSRNALLSPFLIVYVWANALCLFLLKDPAPFLLGAALTASLDLWRHSELGVRRSGRLLVTPLDHAWHHSRERMNCNYGANWKIWDRLHGTEHAPEAYPERLGIALDWSLARKLLLPGDTA